MMSVKVMMVPRGCLLKLSPLKKCLWSILKLLLMISKKALIV